MMIGDQRRNCRRLHRARVSRVIALSLSTLLLSACSDLLSWHDTGHSSYGRHRSTAATSADDSSTLVHPGDTLYSIAFRNNLDYHDLAAWNGIDSSYTIYPGQRLRLSPPQRASYAGARQGVVSTPSQAVPVVSTSPSPMIPAPAPATPVDTIPLPDGQAFSSSHWQWPVSGEVVQRFDPDHGSKGVNIAGHLGETVVAAAPGKVVYSGSALKGYGKLVIIKHDERYLSAYGYNSHLLVQEEQWVHAGQPIAALGEGPEQRDELHFEIRDRGRPVDPLALLPRH